MPRSIVLVIDVEPAGRGELACDAWDGTRGAFEEIARWREQLERQAGAPARFNWFLRCDPQIEAVWGNAAHIGSAFPEFIRIMNDAGDLCGIHPHFWRWDGVRNRWFNDFSDAAWTTHCVRLSIDAFQPIFGHRPQCSRFGDRYCSNELVSLLGAEGIRFDLTLEPGVPDQPLFDDPHATCRLPDYRRAPRAPYRPSSADYLKPAGSGDGRDLWMVPLTTTTPARWLPVRRFPYVMKASRTLNLVLRPKTLWRYLDRDLAAQGPKPLVLVMRTGDLAFPHYLDNFRYLAGRIAGHPGLRGARFSRVDEAVERFGCPQ